MSWPLHPKFTQEESGATKKYKPELGAFEVSCVGRVATVTDNEANDSLGIVRQQQNMFKRRSKWLTPRTVSMVEGRAM